jgi:hypothetical protein
METRKKQPKKKSAEARQAPTDRAGQAEFCNDRQLTVELIQLMAPALETITCLSSNRFKSF